MNHTLLIIIIFVIEVSIMSIMKLYKDKPDILRIWYQDIPFLYVVGPSVMYFLALFQLVGMNTMGIKSIFIFIGVHILIKRIIQYISSIYLQEKYDYFRLLTRYHSDLYRYQYICADILYIIGLILLYQMMNPYVKDRYMNILISIVGYIAFTLTFEDV